MKKMLLIVLALMIAISPTGWAMSFEDADSDDYLVKAPAMIIRGVSHIGLSPLELVYHTYDGTINDTPVLGTLKGIGEGSLFLLDHAGRGAFDILFSLVPGQNGSPSTHEIEMLR